MHKFDIWIMRNTIIWHFVYYCIHTYYIAINLDAYVKLKLASVGQLACSTKWPCGPLEEEEALGPLSHACTFRYKGLFEVGKTKGGGGGGGSGMEEDLLLGNQWERPILVFVWSLSYNWTPSLHQVGSPQVWPLILQTGRMVFLSIMISLEHHLISMLLGFGSLCRTRF